MTDTRANVRFYIRPARITSGTSKTFVYDIVDSAGEHAPARYHDAHTAILTCDLREDDHARALARESAVHVAQDVNSMAVADGSTAPRGEVHVSWPSRPGHGMSRRWTRVLRGKLYSFTAVTMPSGELRYSANRWDGGGVPGTPGHPNFDCEWTRLHHCVRIPAGQVCLWANEDYGLWGPLLCGLLFADFEDSATLPGGRPTISADAVTDHIRDCETCRNSDTTVSLLTDGTWQLERGGVG